MNPARWAHVKEVFHSAHERPNAERDAFIAAACAEDAAVRAEVHRLLAEEAAGSLESPVENILTAEGPLAEGCTIGRYRVEHELGRGGMGAVYRAFDTQLRRPVALKLLPAAHTEDPVWRRRLLNEARAASALNHPNVIAVYEVGSDRGLDFIAMEFVDGLPLSQVIPPDGLPLKLALDYAVQISDGLAKAHAGGVVHRDLKPGNIMVTPDGLVKLLDFGLAHRVLRADAETTLTMAAQVAGTPSYMAPEQAQGREADARADVFSFGAVLYEMLSGRRAFRGNTALAQLDAVLHDEPPSLSGVPAELAQLVSRCLRKDPARRVQHMDDVKLVLRELKEGAESRAASPRARRSWRRPALAALVLAAIVAAAAWWLAHRATPFSASALTRITFDPALAWQPSVSLDGKLVAYASDRSGPFQIYVQQLRGTQSVQLTHNQASNWFPSFSPDGSKIAFRSERDGGGIYLVDALGGPERKIASQGMHPRFAPDGSTIVYLVPISPVNRTGKLYLISSDGGTPKPFQPGFVIPTMGPGYSGPIWSSDGRFVLFDGAPERNRASRDWWIAPVAGAPPVRVKQPPYAPRSLLRTLEAWSGRYVYYSEGTAVGGMSLYRVPVSSERWKITGQPERLTSAGGMQTGASLSADGHLVFASMTAAGRLWQVPLQANEGAAEQRIEPIASDSTVKLELTVAANGSRLAYLANLFGDRTAEIRIRDPASGHEDVIAFSGGRLPVNLRLSPDGTRLAYERIQEGKDLTYVTDSETTTARVICQSCRPLGFFSNGAEGLVVYGSELVRQNLETGARQPLLKAPGGQLVQASVSPGDNWVAFALGRADGSVGLYVTPVGMEPVALQTLTPIAVDRMLLSVVGWSPDGKLLYYTRNRDGFPHLWAQPLAGGKTTGPPRPVFDPYRSGGFRLPVGLQFAITPERLYLSSFDVKGDIWSIFVGAP